MTYGPFRYKYLIITYYERITLSSNELSYKVNLMSFIGIQEQLTMINFFTKKTYDKLSLVFSTDVATGQFARPSTNLAQCQWLVQKHKFKDPFLLDWKTSLRTWAWQEKWVILKGRGVERELRMWTITSQLWTDHPISYDLQLLMSHRVSKETHL